MELLAHLIGVVIERVSVLEYLPICEVITEQRREIRTSVAPCVYDVPERAIACRVLNQLMEERSADLLVVDAEHVHDGVIEVPACLVRDVLDDLHHLCDLERPPDVPVECEHG